MMEFDDEESVTLAVAAYRLGCDPTTVRALLREGQLTGHRIGKGTEPRGVRVHAASIRAYKERHAIEEPPPSAVTSRPRRPELGLQLYGTLRHLREKHGFRLPETDDEKQFWARYGQRHHTKRK
jgi:hypothetical protein